MSPPTEKPCTGISDSRMSPVVRTSNIDTSPPISVSALTAPVLVAYRPPEFLRIDSYHFDNN